MGGGNSLAVPHDASQAWTISPGMTSPWATDRKAARVLPESNRSGVVVVDMASSGCGELELADASQVDMLTREPQTMHILHGQPAPRAAAQGLREAQCHFGSDAAGAVEDTAQRGRRNTEFFGEFAVADVVGLKVDAGDELTG